MGGRRGLRLAQQSGPNGALLDHRFARCLLMTLASPLADKARPTAPHDATGPRRLLSWLVGGNVLAMALIVALAALSLDSSRERFRERALLATDNLAHSLEQALAARFDLIDLGLRSLALQTTRLAADEANTPSQLDRLLAEQHHLMPEVDTLRLFDAVGRASPPVHAASVSGSTWEAPTQAFRATREANTDHLQVSEPLHQSQTKRWVLLLSRRLTTVNGQFAGVVQAEVAVDRFRDMLANVVVGPHGAVTLRTSTLRLVARHTEREVTPAPVGSNRISAELRAQLQQKPDGGTYIARTAIDGIERTNAYRPVRNRPLIVIVGLGTADFLGPWYAQVRQVIALSSVLLLTVWAASFALYQAWRREANTARELHAHRDQLERLVAVRTGEVQASETRFRTFMAATPATAWIKDANGRLVYANAAWEQAFGVASQAWSGRTPFELLPAPMARALQAHDERVRITGLPVESIETTHGGGNTERHWQTVQFLLPAPDGAEQVAGIAIDITRQVQAEFERSAALVREQGLRDAAERQADHLREAIHERDEFVRVLAHEVRQPLNNASAALESAAAELAPGARMEPGQAMQRVRRAQGVIRQIVGALDNTLAATALLTSAERIGSHDADVDVLIDLSLADLDAAQRPRVRVERISSTRTASMDSGLMRLALRNVLSNALAYSPAESPVILRVTDSDEPLALVFEVLDTGPGVRDELLPRLFERGVRGNQDVPGHGIGLYVVRRVMELHGGTVDLRPNEPTGTVFRLWLPQDR